LFKTPFWNNASNKSLSEAEAVVAVKAATANNADLIATLSFVIFLVS